MSVHFTPAHKYDTVLDKGGGLRHFCSVKMSIVGIVSFIRSWGTYLPIPIIISAISYKCFLRLHVWKHLPTYLFCLFIFQAVFSNWKKMQLYSTLWQWQHHSTWLRNTTHSWAVTVRLLWSLLRTGRIRAVTSHQIRRMRVLLGSLLWPPS